MEKVNKTFLKVLGFVSSLLLTIFSGLFGFLSLAALFTSVIEKDLINVLIAAAAAFVSCVCWSVRKEVL